MQVIYSSAVHYTFSLPRHTAQMLFLLLCDFLCAKPFLGNNIRKKPKKTDTGQVRTLNEGNWFCVKIKVSPLQAGL